MGAGDPVAERNALVNKAQNISRRMQTLNNEIMSIERKLADRQRRATRFSQELDQIQRKINHLDGVIAKRGGR
jgi:peptidoglycan hydrolase CwlO-like protein